MAKRILLNQMRLESVADVVAASGVPGEQESSTHGLEWNHDLDALANAYLAIVAICHQTSPIGERRLEGNVAGVLKVGWDYLKERFLEAASRDIGLTRPEEWQTLTPMRLSEMLEDERAGLTLSRVNERTLLLNDLGSGMASRGTHNIRNAFEDNGKRLQGQHGFLQYLHQFIAYSDPVRKKSLFFAAIALHECGWEAADSASLSSPVDYHELRGHLRLGTVNVEDSRIASKVASALPLTDAEDSALRTVVQAANQRLAERTGLTSSVIHYLLWNLFRNCCPRNSRATHCDGCAHECGLPSQYKNMTTYHGRCLFAEVCDSAGKANKVIEPPYAGHYY